MMSKLITFYEQILSAYNMTVDKKGYVSTNGFGNTSPKVIKDKRMALPTRSVLRDPEVSELFVFHPIPEQLNRGESDIIKELVRIANVRFNYTLSNIVLVIADMIANTSNHKNLTDAQTELMLAIGTVDKTAVNNINKVINSAIKQNLTKSMSSIYLKRGGTLNGKRHSCVAVVRFPVFDELSKPGETLYGVKVRDKDRDLIQKILEYVLPDLGEKDRYSSGSHSDFIPYLESLLNMTYVVGSKLNEVIDILGDKITDSEDMLFDLAYYDTLSTELDKILEEARRIPAQFNTPVVDEPDPVQQAPQQSQAAPMAPMPTYAPNPYGQPNYGQQPYQQPAYLPPGYQRPQQPAQPSQVLNENGTVNIRAAMGMSQQGYQQPNVFANNFAPQPMGYQGYQGAPMYQQQPPMNPELMNKPWNQPIGTAVNINPTGYYQQPINPYMGR